jgi:iron complex transport system substrate-binding protein
MRIVSLTCSNTEIVCALGSSNLLVGVDNYSDFPSTITDRLPKVGKDLNIDIDKVVSLKPDLILASLTVPGHENVVAAVKQTGIPFIAPAPVSLQDVADDFQTIGHLIGKSAKGLQLARQLFDETPPIQHPSPPKILVEWWPKPVIVPGKKSWVTDLIVRAGGLNPFAHIDRESTPVDDALVIRAQPDAIIVSWCGIPDQKLNPMVVKQRKSWADLPALQTNQIHIIPESFLGRPGPRLIDGYKALRQVIKRVSEVRNDTT